MTTELQVDEIIGAVFYDSAWRLLAATPYEWRWDSDVGPLTMDEQHRALFRPDQGTPLTATDIKDFYSPFEPASELPWLYIVANFEKCQFVNGFHDLPLEDVSPKGWTSTYGDPYEYVPATVYKAWSQYHNVPDSDLNETWLSRLARRIWGYRK